MSITLNPTQTYNAGGFFNIETTGFIQGTALDDPATRYRLAGGPLAATETLPMWGGVGIVENVPLGGLASSMGGTIKRALTTAVLTGFSVFDQNHAMIISAGNPVPLASPGMLTNFYRIGSRARIVVQAASSLVSMEGNPINASVSWDTTNQRLIPYSTPTVSAGAYNNTTGAVTLTTSAPHGLVPGDTIFVSAAAGTGSFASINGPQTLVTGTGGTSLVFNVATGLTMTITGATVGTGGLLDVNVLEMQIGNSKVVTWNGTVATWNNQGSTAVIEL